ncbi:hypothetical protein CH63R_10369 [Colletotrichum higginsianum IMI 349063]|uniref:Uncharacterized protein n=1 Tax=Colletotrichum higginsianum (strain IMI 349063) TaxID=759273 RepID=A0A1B7Y2L1_COLHI|nr:uncharacterized protein CH63R_10369 [Colletotrichum higginsianum IMI 349063]OBR06249.1 hypothetical protein CH63R_10369 [Colletotrichum higginsianum IMI 349063]
MQKFGDKLQSMGINGEHQPPASGRSQNDLFFETSPVDAQRARAPHKSICRSPNPTLLTASPASGRNVLTI